MKPERWLVSWNNTYGDAIKTANEAVVEALGDLEDALRNVGQGANVFIVEDTKTGTVSVITSDSALSEVKGTTNIINIDQSVNISPTINIYEGGK